MTPLIRRSRSAVPRHAVPRHAVPRHAGEDGGQSGLGFYPTSRYGSACLSIPLCRNGEPEEFGWAAAFVLSPASHITGAMIPVDGGASNSS